MKKINFFIVIVLLLVQQIDLSAAGHAGLGHGGARRRPAKTTAASSRPWLRLVRRKPADSDSHIKKVIISRMLRGKNRPLNDTCPIEQELFKKGDACALLPCRHAIKYEYLDSLQSSTGKCPICLVPFVDVAALPAAHASGDDFSPEMTLSAYESRLSAAVMMIIRSLNNDELRAFDAQFNHWPDQAASDDHRAQAILQGMGFDVDIYVDDAAAAGGGAMHNPVVAQHILQLALQMGVHPDEIDPEALDAALAAGLFDQQEADDADEEDEEELDDNEDAE